MKNVYDVWLLENEIALPEMSLAEKKHFCQKFAA